VANRGMLTVAALLLVVGAATLLIARSVERSRDPGPPGIPATLQAIPESGPSSEERSGVVDDPRSDADVAPGLRGQPPRGELDVTPQGTVDPDTVQSGSAAAATPADLPTTAPIELREMD
jgi:hypothetical protein